MLKGTVVFTADSPAEMAELAKLLAQEPGQVQIRMEEKPPKTVEPKEPRKRDDKTLALSLMKTDCVSSADARIMWKRLRRIHQDQIRLLVWLSSRSPNDDPVTGRDVTVFLGRSTAGRVNLGKFSCSINTGCDLLGFDRQKVQPFTMRGNVRMWEAGPEALAYCAALSGIKVNDLLDILTDPKNK